MDMSARETDGRRLRREVNRRAVVEALAGLHDEGHFEPTIDEIADRSGVSARSVFRYFADLDDLLSEAVALQQRRLGPLLDLVVDRDEPLDERLAAFVAHRGRLLRAMGNPAQVARMRMHDQPIVAAEVTRVRKLLRDQIADVFRPELAQLDPETAADRLAALDVVASFETYRLWRDDHRMSADAAARVMAEAFGCLLAHPSQPRQKGQR